LKCPTRSKTPSSTSTFAINPDRVSESDLFEEETEVDDRERNCPLADERLCFLGRNGIGLCTGLDVFEFDGVVELRPITSKNQIGRAQLSLPLTAVPRFVKSLARIHRKSQNSGREGCPPN